MAKCCICSEVDGEISSVEDYLCSSCEYQIDMEREMSYENDMEALQW
jgi:hypothetical protein